MSNPSENITTSNNDMDRSNFTWANLGKGLIGAVLGGVIEGVGIGASALWRTPQVTYHVLTNLWKTKSLGRNLKSTLTPFAFTGGLCSSAVAVLGGTLHGIFDGFSEGAKNPLSMPKNAIDNIRHFHTKMVDDAIKSMTELAMQKPNRVYEIKVFEAVEGLISGLIGGGMFGLGLLISTVINLPGSYYRISREIWRGGTAMLPFMVGCQVLVTALAVLSLGLVPLVGALGGLGIGAYHGYSKGILRTLGKTFQDLDFFHSSFWKISYGK